MTLPPLNTLSLTDSRILTTAEIAPDIHVITVDYAPIFKAGQYVMMSVAGLPPKPFSIASAPGQPHLEFHIRDTGQSPGSSVLKDVKAGDTLKLSAPIGSAYLRLDAERPLLALGGGMGITPLKSILQAHLADNRGLEAHLYWGGRSREHLYLDRLFQDLKAAHGIFSYIPLLSEEKADLPYRTGFIPEALDQDHARLDDFDIYISGPPVMISSLLPLLLKKGAKKDRIFSDGLETAL